MSGLTGGALSSRRTGELVEDVFTESKFRLGL